MQFQVPQFIETEDKIVGPLTLRQFFYFSIAFVMIFILYYMVTQWLWIMLSAVILGAAFSLAFIKISGRRFHQVIASALSFYWKPQIYVWKPENPSVKKEEALEKSDFLENIIAGIALKNTWRTLQASGQKKKLKGDEHYEIVRRIVGDRQVARRIDYR